MGKQPQTISFELAEKFKTLELDLKYHSCYTFVEQLGQIIPMAKDTLDALETLEEEISAPLRAPKNLYIEAYQLHEILEMLPDSISKCDFYINKYDNKYDINYEEWLDNNVRYVSLAFVDCDENPAEAAGNLLLWCIENNYVKI